MTFGHRAAAVGAVPPVIEGVISEVPAPSLASARAASRGPCSDAITLAGRGADVGGPAPSQGEPLPSPSSLSVPAGSGGRAHPQVPSGQRSPDRGAERHRLCSASGATAAAGGAQGTCSAGDSPSAWGLVT